MGGEKIKLRILIPLTIAIVGLLGSFVSGTFRLMSGALDSQVDQYLASVKKVLRAKHHSEVENLGRIADNLIHTSNLRRAYSDGDRRKVRTILKPIFEELSLQHDVASLYIHDSCKVNFIRAHRPQIFGDTVNHITVQQAARTENPFFGMELSDSGSFTLSMVLPWRHDGEVTGYIELGKELRHITKEVPPAFGVEMTTLIDKRYVSQNAWENTYHPDGEKISWETFSDFVVVDNTFQTIPSEIDEFLSASSEEQITEDKKMSLDDRTYSVAFFPLIDVQNREVGRIAVFYDATLYIEKTTNLLILISAMCLLIGLALFISFYKMLDGLEQELTDSRQKTIHENQLRLEIERRHTKELAAHVLELELARTKALNTAREAELAKHQAERMKKEYLEKQNQSTG